jgi:hypothetical protein
MPTTSRFEQPQEARLRLSPALIARRCHPVFEMHVKTFVDMISKTSLASLSGLAFMMFSSLKLSSRIFRRRVLRLEFATCLRIISRMIL